ncbi:MAG: hypothetical protein ACOY30_02665 [Bacillota bacterium]
MPGKRNSEKEEDRLQESKFKQLLKKELVRWYCNAMHSGKLKPNKSGSSPCPARKA